MIRFGYKHTTAACFIGYITQAMVNNFSPLLFVTYQSQFGIPLSGLTLLITLNFGVQLLVDLAATRFVDKIGYRAAAVGAHLFCVVGLAGLGIFPFVFPSAYAGLVVATICSAMGGGLLEVIVSPIVEALPGDAKAASMSLLHSFYCWGFLAVVLVSSLFFATVGMASWPVLAALWALVPLLNSLFFAKVPILPLVEEEGAQVPLRKLFGKKVFLLLFMMMICAGASEQAMAQWASLFAEAGLGVSKLLGDLLGPCVFTALMGLARILVARQGAKVQLERALVLSGVLCMASYLLTVFAPWPLLSLAGCGLCGLAVGCMWPATFSLASRRYPTGGTAMFAILALAGDAGCASGPAVVGVVSGLVGGGQAVHESQMALKMGILAAIIFPLLLCVGVASLRKKAKS